MIDGEPPQQQAQPGQGKSGKASLPLPAPLPPADDSPGAARGTMRNPRLSFYSRGSMNKKGDLDGGRYGEMSWFDFLVHTELCTMNYDALLHGDTEKLAEMTRVFEFLDMDPSAMSGLDDAALVHHDDYVTVNDGVQPVGNHDDGRLHELGS